MMPQSVIPCFEILFDHLHMASAGWHLIILLWSRHFSLS